jgi:hypothetical protein
LFQGTLQTQKFSSCVYIAANVASGALFLKFAETAAGSACYYLLMAKVGLASFFNFSAKREHFISQQPPSLFCGGEFAIFAHFGVCARQGGKLERASVNAKKGKRERA